MVEAVRALQDQFVGEVGASAWNGLTVVRLCARTAQRYATIWCVL